MDAEQIRRTQVAQVRWMGMAVGGFLVVVGALLTIASVCTAVALLLAIPRGVAAASSTDDIFYVVIPGSELLMGLAFLVWGRSVFHRARTDKVVVVTAAIPAEPGHRGLAWVAVVFSSSMLLMVLATAMVSLRFASLYCAAFFVPVLLGGVRYLRRPSKS